jgi:hypothetical protein
VAEKDIRNAGDPTSEILASSGLVTIMGAVLSAVIAVVTLGQGNAALAAVLGTVAVVSFVVSLACFFSDSNRAEEAPLPFPSWLRSDAEPAAELSAAR